MPTTPTTHATTAPASQPAIPNPTIGGGTLLGVAVFVVLAFLAVVAKLKRPAAPAPITLTSSQGAMIVPVPLPGTPTTHADALAVLTGHHEPAGDPDDPDTQGDNAMGQLADAWTKIKARYAQAIANEKTAKAAAEIARKEADAVRTERDKAVADSTALAGQLDIVTKQLEAARAATPALDAADQAAIDELIGKPKTPAAEPVVEAAAPVGTDGAIEGKPAVDE